MFGHNKVSHIIELECNDIKMNLNSVRNVKTNILEPLTHIHFKIDAKNNLEWWKEPWIEKFQTHFFF